MPNDTARTTLRWIAAGTFVLAGANHFRSVEFYVHIVPPMFPGRRQLVVASGVGEMLGGLGLLVPALRRPAGWGLVALLLAVFPANIYMAVSNDPHVTLTLPRWARWARLPLQAVLIAWVEWSSRPTPGERRGFDVAMPAATGAARRATDGGHC